MIGTEFICYQLNQFKCVYTDTLGIEKRMITKESITHFCQLNKTTQSSNFSYKTQ